MFKENSIIICENDYKNKLLKDFSFKKELLNIKFMSKKEFLDSYFFSYDEKKIYYLYKKYNYKISIIKIFLDSLRYVNEKTYNNEKLDFLVSIKKELNKENLLYYDATFKDYLKDKTIYIAPYLYLEKDEEDFFKSLNFKDVLNKEVYKTPDAITFNNITDEVNYVFKRIANLITNNTDINKIKLVNVSDDYKNIIERIALFYNIPIKLNNNYYLYGTREAKLFLENLSDGKEKAIEKIKNINKDIINKIINICNKYYFIDDLNDLKTFLIYEFKKTNINQNKLENYVELVSLEYPFEDEYVFLMNFNIESIPIVYKDDKYITDDIKDLVNVRKTEDINNIVKENTVSLIKRIKNLCITLKENDLEKKVYPSFIIDDLNISVLEENDDVFESYSILNDKINYAIMLDNYYKYGEEKDNLFVYENTYGNINYLNYDSSYKKIKEKIFTDKINLSYSSVNKYFECKFKYYLNKVLYLDDYEETFAAFIGNLFHFILKEYLEKKDDIYLIKDNYLKENNIALNKKEEFYVNKVLKEVKIALEVIEKQNTYSSLDKRLLEHKVIVEENTYTFKGYIDKILYNDKEEIVIIDYKTGNESISYNLLSSGLNMQLFLYLYLAVNDSCFNNPKIIGFYLQHVLQNEKYSDKDIMEQKEDNLKLNGYSISDTSLLEKFDSSYEDSKVIRSLKLKSDGEFYKYAKVLSKEEIDGLISYTEKMLTKAVEEINDNDFEINPKKVDNKDDVSCNYCPYKEICYKKDSFYKPIYKEEDLSFLGGDNNA